MKKKLLTMLLAVCAVMCLCFGLVACGETGGGTGGATHTHTYATEWTSDDNYHWHAATCEHTDEVSDKAEHTFKNSVCTVCNRRDGIERHSQILQDVVNSSYYVNLIYSNTSKQIVSGEWSYTVYSFKDQEILPIPYGFLERNGYDIEAIKNNELSSTSYPYMLEDEPNSLYIACKAETKASLNYYTCYTLKYTLSDLEVSDLKYLCDNRAAETPLFIQELSYQKTPSVITKASMSVKAYNSILAYMADGDAWSVDLFGCDEDWITMNVLEFSEANNTLEIAFMNEPLNTKQSGKMRYAHLTSGSSTPVGSRLINGTEVYVEPYPYVTFQSSEARNEYKTEYTPITLYGYITGGAALYHDIYRVFEDYYTKDL